MTKGRPGPAATRNFPSHRFANAMTGLVFLSAVIATALAWLVPQEVVQQWAFNRSGSDSYAKFEAIGGAEFALWAFRIVGSQLFIALGIVWWDWNRWQTWFAHSFRGLIDVTNLDSGMTEPQNRGNAVRVRTIIGRVFLACWVLLFLAHVVVAFGQCRREWPYFRFNSGEVVLPNISDTNRAVIRYLQQATPPNARILVASDQKLFFLSYYLRPRVLLHRMHPDSEHVIPLKDQERKLSAYQLSDLSDADLQQMPHDFTLEYFEHPEFVNRSEILSDSKWISFIRQRERDPSFVPNYVVRLRPVEEKRP